MIVKYIEGSRLCVSSEREKNKEYRGMIVQSIKEMSQGHAHHAERERYTKHIRIIVQSIIEEKGVKVMRFIRKRGKKE